MVAVYKIHRLSTCILSVFTVDVVSFVVRKEELSSSTNFFCRNEGNSRKLLDPMLPPFFFFSLQVVGARPNSMSTVMDTLMNTSQGQEAVWPDEEEINREMSQLFSLRKHDDENDDDENDDDDNVEFKKKKALKEEQKQLKRARMRLATALFLKHVKKKIEVRRKQHKVCLCRRM